MKSYQTPKGHWVVSIVPGVRFVVRRMKDGFFQLDKYAGRGTTYIGRWPTRHHAIKHAKEICNAWKEHDGKLL